MSKGLERAYKKRGIELKLGSKFKTITESDAGVSVELENNDVVTADLLLVAVGRAPNATGFGFEEQGVHMDRGFVPTNERLMTNFPGVYAVGDIVPGLQLAHRGFMQGIFVAEEIAGLNPLRVEEWDIPRVTYCEPEIASVGLTEAQAKDKFGPENISIYEYNLAGNGKSNILGTAGVVKLIRQNKGPVVGFHMIGSRAGEQIGEAQLIVHWEAYPEDVAPLIHAHPTMNEAIGEAHLALAGKPLHAHA
jgi:dihydrolipoamide dehydrogenase